jgi:hypothetical protein
MRRKRYQYRALALLTHAATGDVVSEGELIDLSHRSADEIETLIALHCVAREPLEAAAPDEDGGDTAPEDITAEETT